MSLSTFGVQAAVRAGRGGARNPNGTVRSTARWTRFEQLLGQELAEHDDHHSRRPKAPAQALQQLGDDRALLVSGSLPPATVKLEPFWKSRDLRVRADS